MTLGRNSSYHQSELVETFQATVNWVTTETPIGTLGLDGNDGNRLGERCSIPLIHRLWCRLHSITEDRRGETGADGFAFTIIDIGNQIWCHS